jgi:protein-disulfide isomerase
LIVTVVFAAILFSGCASTSTSVPQAADNTKILPADARTLGQATAPVTMRVYCDYACPACTSFQQEYMAKIKSDYINTGKVLVEFYDYPKVFKHPGAVLAAQYADCAAEQGLFWKMHDRLYDGTAMEEWFWGDEADLATFSTYAKEIGADVDKLESCVKTQKMMPQITEDMQTLHTTLPNGAHTTWPDSFVAGEQGTPTFFINGTLVPGSFRTYEKWKSVLDAAIAESK